MSWASSEIVSVLLFLLPGFVAASVFYSLTSYPKPNEFGQVIQALVFTMVGQTIAWAVLYILEIFAGNGVLRTEGLGIAVSVLSAVIFALVAVYVSNNDTLHRLFRYIGLTRENSYPSEWYSAFAENPDCYVMLYLKGNRILYGWIEDWPTHPDKGHFRITEAEWLDDGHAGIRDGEDVETLAILVPASDVEMVEFVKIDSVD